jgi:hypothetical protein
MLFITQLSLSIARVPLKHALIDAEQCFGVAGAMLWCCRNIAPVMREQCVGSVN